MSHYDVTSVSSVDKFFKAVASLNQNGLDDVGRVLVTILYRFGIAELLPVDSKYAPHVFFTTKYCTCRNRGLSYDNVLNRVETWASKRANVLCRPKIVQVSCTIKRPRDEHIHLFIYEDISDLLVVVI